MNDSVPLANVVPPEIAQQRFEQLSRRETLSSITAQRPLLFDARKIADGGIGVYSQSLIGTLVACGIRVALLGDPDKINKYSWASQVEILTQDAPRYSLEEMFLLARRIPFERFSLFHVPHYTLPFGVPIPTVITVHDLIHLTHPETLYHRPIAWAWIASGLLRASLVCTVSLATELDLSQRFGFLRNLKTMMIPNQLPHWARGKSIKSDLLDKVFFVLVSQPKPHKGILDLVTAFTHANDRHGQEFRLIIGGIGSLRLAEKREYAGLLSHRSDIEIVGLLSPEELSGYYARARTVVVPSLAEGFGLMVIEAHAHGTPVLCRPVPALREILTEYDSCAKDFSIEALEQALEENMHHEGVLSSLQRIDLQRSVEKFSQAALEDRIIISYLRTLGLEK